MSFTPRVSKYSPSNMTYSGSVTSTNKWWYDVNINKGSTNELCLPNCTTYVMGRLCELAGDSVNIFPGRGAGRFPRASEWYTSTLGSGYAKASSIKAGHIICFAENEHVAFCESSDGTLAGSYFSMSGYVNASGRSFTNPGETSEWYFKYVNGTTLVNWYGTVQGYISTPWSSDEPTPPTPGDKPEIEVAPERYTVTMEANEDYIDFTFAISMINIPSGESASGGNEYPGLERVFNSGWTYVDTSSTTRNAYKTQTLRYKRESNSAYTVTKYMYFNKTFSTGSVSGTYPMSIIVKKKGGVMFNYDGTEVFIR